jgi:hypothetical protein
MKIINCSGCNVTVDPLDVFPGDRCIECYRPEGEAIAATMTAERLAAMWGAKPRRETKR